MVHGLRHAAQAVVVSFGVCESKCDKCEELNLMNGLLKVKRGVEHRGNRRRRREGCVSSMMCRSTVDGCVFVDVVALSSSSCDMATQAQVRA